MNAIARFALLVAVCGIVGLPADRAQEELPKASSGYSAVYPSLATLIASGKRSGNGTNGPCFIVPPRHDWSGWADIDLALADGASGPAAQAPKPPELTQDEVAMFRGFKGREGLVKLQAQLALEAIAREQSDYLRRVAERLGMPVERLVADFTFDPIAGRLEPKPRAAR